VFGRHRSIQTSVIDLVEKRVLVAEEKGKFVFYPAKYISSQAETNPLINGLAKYYHEGDIITYDAIAACYNDNATSHPQLATIFRSIPEKQLWRYLIGLFVLVIGVVRWRQGSANDEPTDNLVGSMLMLLFVYIVLYTGLTNKNALQNVIKKRYCNRQLGQQFDVPSAVNQFAFLGVIALGTDYYVHNIQDSFRKNTPAGGDGGSSSGCGSSCGGGGGGGCGGCSGS
jgi:hypothetical protein